MRHAARNTVSAFRAGFDARYAGKSPNDCPYRSMADAPLPDVERKEWIAGWNTADRQLTIGKERK